MVKRTVLSRHAILWETGDPAHQIAILEQGRLGIQTEGGVAGVIHPKMVFGEAALFDFDGKQPRRTATLVALEDDTTVIEYPASLVKEMVEAGNHSIAKQVLKTLVGQICRHCLLLMSANKDTPVIRRTMNSLLTGTVQSASELESLSSWDDFLTAFRYLCRLRDSLGGLAAAHAPMESVGGETLERVASSLKEVFRGEDLTAYIEEFVRSEKDHPVS